LSSSWAQSWTNASDMNQAGDMADNTGGAFFGPGFASGTDNAPGGLALVGEHGPEILNIPKGAQVIPNDVLRNGRGGGTTVHTGTSITVQGSADQATLALTHH
jgi:phage-related tail protein